jgi:hypothetical protein
MGSENEAKQSKRRRCRQIDGISNLRTVQLLLGYPKIESTDRYLGNRVRDTLSIAEQIDL